MQKIEMSGWIMAEHGVPNSLLTVIKEDTEYEKLKNTSRWTDTYWVCQCACGNKRTFAGSRIRDKKHPILSCGCLTPQLHRGKHGKDLLGKTFNFLTVIELTEERKRKTNLVWLCKCKCGKIITATTSDLIQERVKSCGCLQKEKVKATNIARSKNKELVGKRFGLLTVIDIKSSFTRGKPVLMICKCKCGNIVKTTYGNLTSGNSTSCGCLKSKGEEKIASLLREYNISFIQQKTYENCRNIKTNYLLFFDFYIENNFLLEVDGIQHFQVISGWDDNEQLFKERQERDIIKNNFCLQENITLKRIPYYALKTLTIEDIMGDKYICIKGDKNYATSSQETSYS